MKFSVGVLDRVLIEHECNEYQLIGSYILLTGINEFLTCTVYILCLACFSYIKDSLHSNGVGQL